MYLYNIESSEAAVGGIMYYNGRESHEINNVYHGHGSVVR